MSSGAVVSTDQVSLGVLVASVPRDVIDGAVTACGVGVKRSGGKLPAHVVAYLVMAMWLFSSDDYEEVATKVTGALDRWGCWDAGWSVPSASAITQARKRLGGTAMQRIFEGIAEPVATSDTRGAWLRDWRLTAIDGFDVDLPDSDDNAEAFGYRQAGHAVGKPPPSPFAVQPGTTGPRPRSAGNGRGPCDPFHPGSGGTGR